MKSLPSRFPSSAAEAAKGAETYAFYVALTDAIVALVGRVRRDDPAQLMFGGMDLSHAFEAYLYFACVHDAGLIGLHENPGGLQAANLLQRPGRLLALNGFGRGAASRVVIVREAIGKIFRAVKWGAALSPSPAIAVSAQASVIAPILFFCRSSRFASYFRPIADGLRGRCAFLIPVENDELRELVSGWSHSVLCYGVPGRAGKPMGKMLAGYGPHLAAFTETIETVLAQSRGRLLVIPEGNAPEDEIANRVAQKLGWNTACLQQGWSPIVHPGFRNLSYSVFLVWGKGFAELLQPYNPGQRFEAVGNHRLPSGCVENGERSGVVFLFQGFENWLGGRQSADAMLLLTERIADAGWPVFIRPHPAVPFPEDVLVRLSLRPAIQVEPASKVGLGDALTKARVSVSAYSTAILESIATGTVPVIFNTTSMPRYWPDVEAAGAGIEAADMDAAESAILRLLEDRAYWEGFSAPMTAFAARFFLCGAEAALANIETALLRLSELAQAPPGRF